MSGRTAVVDDPLPDDTAPLWRAYVEGEAWGGPGTARQRPRLDGDPAKTGQCNLVEGPLSVAEALSRAARSD